MPAHQTPWLLQSGAGLPVQPRHAYAEGLIEMSDETKSSRYHVPLKVLISLKEAGGSEDRLLTKSRRRPWTLSGKYSQSRRCFSALRTGLVHHCLHPTVLSVMTLL